MRAARREHPRDSGQATLEFVALIPLVTLAMVLLIDVIGVVWATNAADQAAYNGARALSLEEDMQQAVSRTLPGSIRTWSAVTVEQHGVRVTVQAPGPGLIGTKTITREVILP